MKLDVNQQFEKRFEEFVERTTKDFDLVKTKLDSLWDFRHLLLGASFVISAFCSFIITAVVLYFEVKH